MVTRAVYAFIHAIHTLALQNAERPPVLKLIKLSTKQKSRWMDPCNLQRKHDNQIDLIKEVCYLYSQR